MKGKIFLSALLLLSIMQLLYLEAKAQTNVKYIPDTGFWQLVSNNHIKNEVMIQFYNNDSELIYEESLTGIKLNINRNKTRRWLKEGLEKALLNCTVARKLPLKENWMAVITKK